MAEMPVPLVVEEIMEVNRLVPQERIRELNVEETIDVPVLQAMKETAKPIPQDKVQNRTVEQMVVLIRVFESVEEHVDVPMPEVVEQIIDVLVLQMKEEIIEVVKRVPEERAQKCAVVHTHIVDVPVPQIRTEIWRTSSELCKVEFPIVSLSKSSRFSSV